VDLETPSALATSDCVLLLACLSCRSRRPRLRADGHMAIYPTGRVASRPKERKGECEQACVLRL